MNIENVVNNLKRRKFDVSVFETKEEAKDYLVEKIVGRTVGFGGSVTAKQMGLFRALQPGNDVCDHSITGDVIKAMEHAARADVFITSANAVTEDGELVNIDGRGNRVAATLYGKKEVYVIVGVNKFTPDLESAIWRARNIAAPKNAQRLGRNVPCAAKADKCYDCNSPERLCNGLVVHWGKPFGIEKMEVVIINEELGY